MSKFMRISADPDAELRYTSITNIILLSDCCSFISLRHPLEGISSSRDRKDRKKWKIIWIDKSKSYTLLPIWRINNNEVFSTNWPNSLCYRISWLRSMRICSIKFLWKSYEPQGPLFSVRTFYIKKLYNLKLMIVQEQKVTTKTKITLMNWCVCSLQQHAIMYKKN